MRLLVATALVVLWSGACGLAFLAVKDRPLLPARDPAPPVTTDTTLYVDRDYRLESVPEFLADAVVVRTYRHGADPVTIRVTEPAVLWYLAPEGDPPADWAVAEPAPREVLCRGAQRDLTRAWYRPLPVGDHLVRPLGPRNVASPLLVVCAGEVREIETPAGLLRRAEVATRGFPRRRLVQIGGAAVVVGVLIGLVAASRRRRKTGNGNGLPRPD